MSLLKYERDARDERLICRLEGQERRDDVTSAEEDVDWQRQRDASLIGT